MHEQTITIVPKGFGLKTRAIRTIASKVGCLLESIPGSRTYNLRYTSINDLMALGTELGKFAKANPPVIKTKTQTP